MIISRARVLRASVVACRPISASASALGLFACIALALSVSSTPALASACPNEQLRQESRVRPESNLDPTAGQPYSAGLPDCRAYEMVSPLYKQSFDAVPVTGSGVLVAPAGGEKARPDSSLKGTSRTPKITKPQGSSQRILHRAARAVGLGDILGVRPGRSHTASFRDGARERLLTGPALRASQLRRAVQRQGGTAPSLPGRQMRHTQAGRLLVGHGNLQEPLQHVAGLHPVLHGWIPRSVPCVHSAATPWCP